MLDLGGFMLDIYFLENTNRSFNDLYLCYCGLEKCVPLYSFGPAVRPNYLIHYVLDGEGYYYVNDNKYKVRKNQGFLIEPMLLHFIKLIKIILGHIFGLVSMVIKLNLISILLD